MGSSLPNDAWAATCQLKSEQYYTFALAPRGNKSNREQIRVRIAQPLEMHIQ